MDMVLLSILLSIYIMPRNNGAHVRYVYNPGGSDSEGVEGIVIS